MAQEPAAPATAPARRVDSIDLLRGAVMVLMALDHARDFFTNSTLDPADLRTTTPALFLTRWVTHFCAPVFVFLAGMGAMLYRSRGRSWLRLAWFLVSRGLWLVLLQFTLVHLGWYFNLEYPVLHGDVIWAIGCSMVLLAALAALPAWAVAGVGAALVLGHNALDSLTPPGEAPYWMVAAQLRRGVLVTLGGRPLRVAYPVLPWLGVMCLGYGAGALWVRSPRRRLWLALAGATAVGLFACVRGLNGYGDPRPWSAQAGALWTLFSFVNCTKYPPSLDYLLMTLGPALLLLASLGQSAGRPGRVLVTFGRVPLFFYLTHLFLLHLLAMAAAWLRYGHAGFLFNLPLSEVPRRDVFPPDYGYGLAGIYLAWVTALAVLYPLCLWFEGMKRRDRSGWTSYL